MPEKKITSKWFSLEFLVKPRAVLFFILREIKQRSVIVCEENV